MPGIVGIINRGLAPDAADRQVAAMVESMMYERFYTSGTCAFPELAIHAGWVAHEQSMAANQVFWNERRDIALLFAGECFVDPQVRTELKRRGHQPDDRAGDWLVHFYEEKGQDFFQALNGLFGGLLIDLRQRQAFLFNDRCGIERLYWFEEDRATYFASEAKALLRVCPQLRTFDEAGVVDFLTFGCTLEWRTLFRGMHLAPGGSLWTVANGRCHRSRYFDAARWESEPVLPDAEFEARFHEIFERILPRYFESNCQVGISLTGGLDTRMIMACSAWNGARPMCYTFAGQQGRTLDARIAAEVASVSGLDHRLIRINPDFLSEFAAVADRTVYITDGTLGVNGAHEVYLNRVAREMAPVRITGNFGSEVLRSMSTFKRLKASPDLVRPELRSAISECERTQARQQNPVSFAAFREIPWILFGSLAAGRSQVLFRTPYLDNEVVTLAFRASQAIRESPGSALRFIQHNCPSLSQIPTDRGLKGDGRGMRVFLLHLFCEVAFKLEYYYNEGPPAWLSRLDPLISRLGAVSVAGTHKYLPYRHWYQSELADYVAESLAAVQRRQSPFWNPAFLRSMMREHLAGRRNPLGEINTVLTLEAVERLLLRAW